ALLGVGNLGVLFTDGLQRTFVTEVVVGIIAILVLALIMDAILVILERLLTPWTRAVGGKSQRQDANALLTEPKSGPAVPHPGMRADPEVSS
ncbi:ABC transporter permease, partial [Paenarthrobacter sp. RAF9]